MAPIGKENTILGLLRQKEGWGATMSPANAAIEASPPSGAVGSGSGLPLTLRKESGAFPRGASVLVQGTPISECR